MKGYNPFSALSLSEGEPEEDDDESLEESMNHKIYQ